MSMNAQQPADRGADLAEDLEPTARLIAEKADTTASQQEKAHRPISRGRLVWRRLKGKPNFYIGGAIVLAIVAFALFGDLFNIYTQGQQDSFNFNSPPSAQHYFGTDAIGVDLYASMTSALRRAATSNSGRMRRVLGGFAIVSASMRRKRSSAARTPRASSRS